MNLPVFSAELRKCIQRCFPVNSAIYMRFLWSMLDGNKSAMLGMIDAVHSSTQPPFGSVKQVLNEESTRCRKMTQFPAAFPSSLHRSVPAQCLPPKGHFYAPCVACNHV